LRTPSGVGATYTCEPVTHTPDLLDQEEQEHVLAEEWEEEMS
jgi:hypothetical protein